MADQLTLKKGFVWATLLGVFLLAFLVLKEIIIPITLALIFAYIFSPVNKFFISKLRNRTFATLCLLLFVSVIIIIPLIFLTPIIVNQTFQAYVALQDIDFAQALRSVFGKDAAATIAANLDSLLGKVFSTFINQFTGFLVNLPSILLQFAVFMFTFFFALRDADKMKDYLSSLSPFTEATEKKFMAEFRGITNAIIFGQVLIGVLQGILLGIGLFALGVPSALTLMLVGILVSIIPILGSWIVWLPVGMFMLVKGETFSGVFLLLYGLLFVSTIDNILRPYILSKRSTLPLALSVVGTIGGFYFFGIMGLVFGPLVLAYALIILEFYREGKLHELSK